MLLFAIGLLIFIAGLSVFSMSSWENRGVPIAVILIGYIIMRVAGDLLY